MIHQYGIRICLMIWIAFDPGLCSLIQPGPTDSVCYNNIAPAGPLINEYYDCAQLKDNGADQTGVYEVATTICPTGSGNRMLLSASATAICCKQVFCDMDLIGGGWTFIQQRIDGHLNFTRNKTEYENGFGSMNSEHWLGLKYIHQMTQTIADTYTGKYEVIVAVKEEEYDCWRYEQWEGFQFDHNPTDPTKYYKLKLNTGPVGNMEYSDEDMEDHKDTAFSTYDSDLDGIGGTHCAQEYKGGWWYGKNGKCHTVNLNGEYSAGCGNEYGKGIVHGGAKIRTYSFSESFMAIRPFQFTSKNTDPNNWCFEPRQTEPCTDNICEGGSKEYEDCAEFRLDGANETGVYQVLNDWWDTTCSPRIACCHEVYCDMETAGGGWTVMQQRFDGSVSFNRRDTDYEEGFGDINPTGEFWLGLRYSQTMVKNYHGDTDLLLGLQEENYDCWRYNWHGSLKLKRDNGHFYGLEDISAALMSNMEGNPSTKTLLVAKGLEFSTPETDRDGRGLLHCAATYDSGWWFGGGTCHVVNLNGVYEPGCGSSSWYSGTGIVHKGGHSSGNSYKFPKSFMAIRRSDFLFNNLTDTNWCRSYPEDTDYCKYGTLIGCSKWSLPLNFPAQGMIHPTIASDVYLPSGNPYNVSCPNGLYNLINPPGTTQISCKYDSSYNAAWDGSPECRNYCLREDLPASLQAHGTINPVPSETNAQPDGGTAFTVLCTDPTTEIEPTGPSATIYCIVTGGLVQWNPLPQCKSITTTTTTATTAATTTSTATTTATIAATTTSITSTATTTATIAATTTSITSTATTTATIAATTTSITSTATTTATIAATTTSSISKTTTTATTAATATGSISTTTNTITTRATTTSETQKTSTTITPPIFNLTESHCNQTGQQIQVCDTCFSLLLDGSWHFERTKAEAIISCHSHGANLAIIPSIEMYKHIFSDVIMPNVGDVNGVWAILQNESNPNSNVTEDVQQWFIGYTDINNTIKTPLPFGWKWGSANDTSNTTAVHEYWWNNTDQLRIYPLCAQKIELNETENPCLSSSPPATSLNSTEPSTTSMTPMIDVTSAPTIPPSFINIPEPTIVPTDPSVDSEAYEEAKKKNEDRWLYNNLGYLPPDLANILNNPLSPEGTPERRREENLLKVWLAASDGDKQIMYAKDHPELMTTEALLHNYNLVKDKNSRLQDFEHLFIRDITDCSQCASGGGETGVMTKRCSDDPTRPGKKVCICHPGFKGDMCSIDIQECRISGNQCEHGKCVDRINEFLCDCDAGWRGERCEISKSGAPPDESGKLFCWWMTITHSISAFLTVAGMLSYILIYTCIPFNGAIFGSKELIPQMVLQLWADFMKVIAAVITAAFANRGQFPSELTDNMWRGVGIVRMMALTAHILFILAECIQMRGLVFKKIRGLQWYLNYYDWEVFGTIIVVLPLTFVVWLVLGFTFWDDFLNNWSLAANHTKPPMATVYYITLGLIGWVVWHALENVIVKQQKHWQYYKDLTNSEKYPYTMCWTEKLAYWGAEVVSVVTMIHLVTMMCESMALDTQEMNVPTIMAGLGIVAQGVLVFIYYLAASPNVVIKLKTTWHTWRKNLNPWNKDVIATTPHLVPYFDCYHGKITVRQLDKNLKELIEDNLAQERRKVNRISVKKQNRISRKLIVNEFWR